MKTLVTLIFAAAVILGMPPALAADQRGAKEQKTATRASPTNDMERQMAQLQEHMKKMQEQMNRIQKAAPKDREPLMNEQLQIMRQGLLLLREPTTVHATSESQAGPELKKRQDLLERRMHLLQLMMDHMILREQIIHGSAK